MREILFRGKTTTEYEKGVFGEWKTGFYTCFNGEEHRIYSGYAETDCGDYYPEWCNVIPETVGQYTGLTDKNGTKIFEGDIMCYAYSNQKSACVVKFGKFNCDCGECMCGWYLDGGNGGFFNDNLFGFEVIGNVHDNPKLLGGDNQ